MSEEQLSVVELLGKLIAVEGSDLHLKVGSPPVYRIDGALHLSNLPKLRAEDTVAIAAEVMPEHLKADFSSSNEADFAFGQPNLGRFRVNTYRQRGSGDVGIFAPVTPASQNFEELGLPDVLVTLAQEPRGLILVTGPTGSGKSTTQASIIDHINSNRRCNIITLEDPIEVLHPDKLSIVSQRECGGRHGDLR